MTLATGALTYPASMVLRLTAIARREKLSVGNLQSQIIQLENHHEAPAIRRLAQGGDYR